jgi:hypothetical protein
VLCVDPSGTGQMTVTLDNIGMGHNFPSGATQDRRVWLELIAYDARDQVLYSSGVVDDQTPVVEAEAADDRLILLRDKTFDRDGNVAHMFWDVATYESNTIPGVITNDRWNPDGTENPDFNKPLRTVSYLGPVGLVPDTVTLRVLVRPMGLEVIDELIATAGLDPSIRDRLPTFDIVPDRRAVGDGIENDVTLRWRLSNQQQCVESGVNPNRPLF